MKGKRETNLHESPLNWRKTFIEFDIYFLFSSQSQHTHDSGNIKAAARCSLLSYFCVFSSIDIMYIDMRSHRVSVCVCSKVIANVQKPVKLERNENPSLQKSVRFYSQDEMRITLNVRNFQLAHLIGIFTLKDIMDSL